MKSREMIAGYQLYGEPIEYIGDIRWDDYIRHKRITENY